MAKQLSFVAFESTDCFALIEADVSGLIIYASNGFRWNAE